ncbi:MAG: PEGA domain-containing protein [Methanomicrobiales archaeon]|jgi:hypothetical protein|nr:PEGA domain-containing protein [Burkholderiaceae bacterium]NLH26024.1 PEGA domain-containing protein [Methanomicrobiales archaeon]HNL85638.1 PEGA domain-containing protein [Methanoregulaceae archaeon]HNO07759.1 PEGA domain-containing protein [Methanoregulaceae archaeon]HNW80210.1 PEGA domain-containing protein [Methanoregulaceae archaeon]
MNKSVLIGITFIMAFSLVASGASQQGTGEAVGYFSVASVPGEAQVVMDSIYRGNTPVVVPVPLAGTPSHTLTVSKPGYLPWVRTYETGPGAGQTFAVNAVLEPSAERGTLIVTTSPAGALVTIDGTGGQQAPWTYRDIPSGSHVVRAFLSGFQPYLTIVNVPPGGTITVDASLLPLSRIGALQVKSNPGGADIYIDGFYSGSTATTVGNLAAGEHFVTLRLAGYQDWLGTVDIPENSVAFIDARLEVASAPTTGDILVSSNPPGAAVFNDEVYVGNTMPDDALDLTGLLPGFHTIRLELQNYQDFTVQVEVESGQIRIVDADMVLATNPSQSGSLLVNSDPQGANVFLDNACIGITPLSVPSVTAGNHTLLIRLAGYNDYSTTFTIAPGEAVQIQAALGPAATPINIGILTLSAAAVAMIFFLRKK